MPSWSCSCVGTLGTISYICQRGPIIENFHNICFLSILQLSFQMWTNHMQETLNSKKKGDVAFRIKDFRAAIDCYTQVFLSLS